MRVLLVPEVYRRDDATANGTLSDLVTWVEQWLTFDSRLHVYWLLPPHVDAEYELADVLADRDRVTLLEARTPMSDGSQYMFTETGYTDEQLHAIESIYKAGGYVDVVVDQLRTGRFDLYKWLLEHTDHRSAKVRPFDVVAHVHDLQLPFKYRGNSYRNEYQMQMEICGAAFADGVWFSAGVDADGMREHAEFLDDEVLATTMDESVEVGSPIDFSRFEEVYSEQPGWLHVAGSGWKKKRLDVVMDVASTLYEQFDIRTVITSVEDVPAEYTNVPWVEAHPHASRGTYEAALRRGDITVCATMYETLARTWFEQAASGQVLVARDRPWLYDCMPDDYQLVGGLDELADLAAWAVEHWDEAVAENKRMVEHVQHIRSPERTARVAYDDLRRRVEEKTGQYDLGDEPAFRESVEDAESSGVTVDELLARTTERGPTDLRYALRSLGWRDAGNPGTPIFERVAE